MFYKSIRIIMLSMLTGSAKHHLQPQSILLSELEEEISKNELFYKQVENWKNAEQAYISRIGQIVNSLRDRSHRLTQQSYLRPGVQGNLGSCPKLQEHRPLCASKQFSKMLQVLIDSHQSFLSKINFDIFMVNLESAWKLTDASKRLLDEERQQQRLIVSKKEQIEKVLCKKQKLQKMKEEEQMCQIFMSDSIDFTLDQKIRKKSKAREYEKESQQYELKMREVVQEYKGLFHKERELLSRIRRHSKELGQGKLEILLKLKLHWGTYWKNLINQLQQINNFEERTCNCCQEFVLSQLESREDKLLTRLTNQKSGFVQNSLRLINQKTIDDLIDYTRDREVKGKIRRMMESDEVDPTETDETSRLVKLIRKVLEQDNVESECIGLFGGIVRKGGRQRLGFVFVMQFFRLNGKFEINPAQIYPLHCLISEFLEAVMCYQARDSFALKQMMILLMTYYVTHSDPKVQPLKLYIIHFFKKNPLWKQLDYWESILLECIYLEKKNTINAMVIGSSGNLNRKKELLEGERAAILNQMLIVVRNMIIFQFSEKEVKGFAVRFIKLLRQDEKFQKDVVNTIEEAIKEQTQLNGQQKEAIKQYYRSHFNRSQPQSYSVPLNLRRSYIQ